MSLSSALLLVSAICLLVACNSSPLPPKLQSVDSFDMLIENGLVVDGSGNTPFRAGIIIQSDTIAYVGDLPVGLRAATKINAAGKMVTPGFIDAHAHGDPLKTPEFHNFLAQGITTICLGQDGFSSGTGHFREWMDSVEMHVPAVNIAVFTGHSSLRMMLNDPFVSQPSEAELEIMLAELNMQLENGSLGLSLGLEYVPGKYAQQPELASLAALVGKKEGLLMAHIRNEDDEELFKSLDEFLSLGEYAAVHISHLKSVYGKGQLRAKEIQDYITAYLEKGYSVSADIYPYTASFTGIGIVFPDWALPPANYAQIKKEQRQELTHFIENKVAQRNGPEATLFGTAPYAGKSLADLEADMNKPFADILIDDIGPGGASAAYFVMDEQLQNELLKSDWTVISTDGSPGMRHPRGYGSFGKIIEKCTGETKLFPIEQAVHKMSGKTAAITGLSNRGLLKAGYKADLLIFNPDSVRVKASYEKPHYLTEGFDFVVVNGKVARENGNFSTSRSGQVIR